MVTCTTVTEADLEAFVSARSPHPSLVELWRRQGAVEYGCIGHEGTWEHGCRVMTPEQIEEVLSWWSVGSGSGHEFISLGVPFFCRFDSEYLILAPDGRILYPETDPPWALAQDLDEFIARIEIDSEHFEKVFDTM